MSFDEKTNSREWVKRFFKNDKGQPFILTDGQLKIFDAIAKKQYPRIHVETPTRYGKSETISLAVLTRIATYPEKWVIAAGEKEKAGIIIGDCIKHIFDSEYTHSKFVFAKGEDEERIKRFRNKDKINFNLGHGLLGELFITTAAGAMGLGAPNVVEDESALINENDHALVMRMLGDQPENFLVKVGNPWESDHFRKSHDDENYYKIIIDYHQAIKEGRLLPAYVDEMRKQPFFDVLYECKFPKQGIIDYKGWVQLLTRDEIDRAMIETARGFGINKLGVDVAGGGKNFSVVIQRYSNYARKLHKSGDPDTMNLVEVVLNIKEKDNPQEAAIDKIGVGKGHYDLLNRMKPGWVVGVNNAEKAIDESRFVNKRAENYWKLREWVLAGGKLERDDDWYELSKIKYRVQLEGKRGKMQIMSKEDMLKDGIQSPDVADALANTFATQDMVPMDPEEEEMERMREDKSFDPHNPFPE